MPQKEKVTKHSVGHNTRTAQYSVWHCFQIKHPPFAKLGPSQTPMTNAFLLAFEFEIEDSKIIPIAGLISLHLKSVHCVCMQ